MPEHWFWSALLAGFSVGLALAVFLCIATRDAECAGYACQGHICVEDYDCPTNCFCARTPWEPQGVCR